MSRNLQRCLFLGGVAFALVACGGHDLDSVEQTTDRLEEEENGMDSIGADDTVEPNLDVIDPTPEPSVIAGFTASCPVKARISQGFHGGHDGVDLAAPLGTPMFAVGPGVVTASGPAQGYGQWIRIKHDDGSMTEYGHMRARHVGVGARVNGGQHIADVGSEGQSTGPHLHLRTYRTAGDRRGINPVEYLGARGLSIPCTPGGANPPPGPGPIPAGHVQPWSNANVRSCPQTSCEKVSSVVANENYPAHCWTVGQSITDAGVTNDKWVRLPLNAGGVGYVSGVYLRGDETGGVTQRCD